MIYGDQINKQEFWWHFEEMLSHIDYNCLMEPAYEAVLSPSRAKNFLSGQLPPLFGYWILQMKRDVRPDLTLDIDKDAMFLTFNYTLTLENAYHVKDANVWHIHRSIKDKEPVIIGHDTSTTELSKQMFKAFELHPEMRRDIADEIMKQVANGAKNVNGNIYRYNLEHKFDQYCEIKHFIAMGFSFNDIDMPYIREIWNVNRHKEETDWTLYCYSEDEDIKFTKKLVSLGVNEEQINPPIWWNK
jgi:hypothetical protein